MDTITPTTEEIVRAMEVYGGSFVQSIATAFRHADSNNFMRLKNAFPDYWIEYTQFAQRVKLKNMKGGE